MCHFKKCVAHNSAYSFPVRPRDKIKKSVPKFYLSGAEAGRKSCVIQTAHQTGSFARVRKKVCSSQTLKNISFEENIPMSQGLVTLEASVLCFFCIYSFPVSASSLVSAEIPSAEESMNRSKPKMEKIVCNEIKCLSKLKI